MDFNLTILIECTSDNNYVTSFAEIPCVHSQGETIDIAVSNCWDALKLYLDYQKNKSLSEITEPYSSQLFNFKVINF